MLLNHYVSCMSLSVGAIQGQTQEEFLELSANGDLLGISTSISFGATALNIARQREQKNLRILVHFILCLLIGIFCNFLGFTPFLTCEFKTTQQNSKKVWLQDL
eukprot:TRINITY_DN36987_c2_g1_i5.p2 TRINITY_DN36987_c2_g1~~TRINITY_DN36987_c2_g1_i5.p2  ORF type:complete len:104 (+),score=7.12 TRINITY_DN36987_c2_g1_i5:125-436(+)